MSHDVDHDTDHRSSRKGGGAGRDDRPAHRRILPFLGLLAVGVVGLPILETISWGIGRIDPASGTLIKWGWVITGLILGLLALAIGLKVTRRVPFVVWHVVVTCVLAGLAAGITTDIGWAYSRFWTVMHAFGSLLLPASWALYRIDALRAAATGKSSDGWADVIGLAKSRPKKIRTDEAHVYVEVEHGPGDTSETVRGAAKKLESAAGAIEGKTIVTPGERADTSLITMTMADPFAEWRKWPGLSHPGRSFAYPLRTAYYANGAHQWFAFVRSLRSPHTDFVSPMASFVGAVGTTGAGKSGFLTNAGAEVLSRTDAVLVWVDADKFFQNAGWCVDMLAMAAKDKPGIRQVTKALRKLAEFRVTKFGQAQLDAILDPEASQIGREWTPELAAEMREPAVVVFGDEADSYMDGEDWKWLFARGRSLGIFLVPAMPRASSAEIPALIRGSVGTWKTFAIGDNYSGGAFTISQATSDAGADPSKFRAAGLHYLDRAPGVDERLYSTPAREYQSDPGKLRRELLAVRAEFTPMTLSAESVTYMGEHYEKCRPDVVMGVKAPLTDDALEGGEGGSFDAERTQVLPRQPGAGFAPSSDGGDEYETSEEEPLRATAEGTSIDGKEVAPIDIRFTDPELARELSTIDPRAPITPRPFREPILFNASGEKPKWAAAETEAELDRVLIEFHREGRESWGNQDVMDAMRCEFSASTVSRRLEQLRTGSRIVPKEGPPIIVVERLGRGQFTTTRVQPGPTAS